MRLTLGDLLEQPDLGLRLRTGGPDAAAVLVEGAHSAEIADPVRWLPEHWIMLTTGVRLRSRPAEQRRLIAQLDGGGIAALGFGEGVVSRQIPPALVEEAEARGFPVFAVPFETGFREIVSFVNRSLLSNDLYVMQRVASVQDYLLDALHLDSPELEVLRRLESVLKNADVAFLDGNGRVISSSGPVAEAAHVHVQDGLAGMREIWHADHWGIAAPVQRPGEPTGWLIVLPAGGETVRQLVKSVTRTAARLLSLPGVDSGSTAARRRTRRRLAASLVDLPADVVPPRLGDALAAAGIDFVTPARIARLGTAQRGRGGRGDPGARVTVAEFADAVDRILDGAGVVHVSGPVADDVIVLAQDDLGELERWLDGASLNGHSIRAGVSSEVRDLGDIRRALCSARLALENACAGGSTVVRHDDLDPLTVLVSALSDTGLRRRLASELVPLMEHPRLLETLQVYFECDCAVARAAQVLGVHPNSLRYRLAKIEKMLGCSLASPKTIARLYLAFLEERTHARRETDAGQEDQEAGALSRRQSATAS